MPATVVTYGEAWSIRSWNIHRVPTVQPWSTSPIRSLSGTRTSVMNSWQKSLNPLSISIRWISTPSWWSGRMNTDRPRCFGTSQFVRARHRPQSENHAPVVHTFEPFRIHSSPSRTAVINAPATSEPPLGSDSSCIHSSSPRRMAGRWRSFCSSVPNSNSTAAHGANVGAWIRNG